MDPLLSTLPDATATAARLRAIDSVPAAAGDDPAKVARQFEAIFAQQLVVAMRQSADTLGDGLFGGDTGSTTYADWFDRNMAEHLAANGGIGLAEVIEADIRRSRGQPAPTPETES